VLGVTCCSIFKEYDSTAGVLRSGCTPLGEIFAPAGTGAPGTMSMLESGTFLRAKTV